MDFVIQLNRNRSNNTSAPPIAAPQTNGTVASPGAASRNHPNAAARNYEDESWKSLLVLVVVFTVTAIAMSVSVVLAGSNTWAEAVPLIIFVVVFALTKIFLANALLYVMIRSDAHSEAVAAATAAKIKAAGMVIRRPRIPPGFNRPKIAGARPRNGASASNVRFAILARKPANPPPRRTDH
jgi:membrane glycosyltransferase